MFCCSLTSYCGAAELRSCGVAELRSCGVAGLRSCGVSELRSCGVAELRVCGVAVCGFDVFSCFLGFWFGVFWKKNLKYKCRNSDKNPVQNMWEILENLSKFNDGARAICNRSRTIPQRLRNLWKYAFEDAASQSQCARPDTTMSWQQAF